jgi:hypothetical protein
MQQSAEPGMKLTRRSALAEPLLQAMPEIV